MYQYVRNAAAVVFALIASVATSHLFLAICSLALAAFFAFKRTLRFSVRDLLVTTTVVAAALGLMVYTVR